MSQGRQPKTRSYIGATTGLLPDVGQPEDPRRGTSHCTTFELISSADSSPAVDTPPSNALPPDGLCIGVATNSGSQASLFSSYQPGRDGRPSSGPNRLLLAPAPRCRTLAVGVPGRSTRRDAHLPPPLPQRLAQGETHEYLGRFHPTTPARRRPIATPDQSPPLALRLRRLALPTRRSLVRRQPTAHGKLGSASASSGQSPYPHSSDRGFLQDQRQARRCPSPDRRLQQGCSHTRLRPWRCSDQCCYPHAAAGSTSGGTRLQGHPVGRHLC